MALFKKKKQDIPEIPPSFNILPENKPFSEEELQKEEDELFKEEDEELENEEEVEEQALISPQSQLPIQTLEPLKDEEELSIDEQGEKLKKQIEELDKKIAENKEKRRKEKEEVEKKQKNIQIPIPDFENRTIIAFQNHEERLKNIESALFRIRGSI